MRGKPDPPCVHGLLDVRRNCRPCYRQYRRRWDAEHVDSRRASRRRSYDAVRAKARNRELVLRNLLIRAWLKDVPCMDCGQRFPWPSMDFDHRDASQKRCKMSRYMTIEDLQAEAMKCDVVCANCHRMRTYNRLRGLGVRGIQQP